MALGIALLLIFILYLIDKHNLWRKAVKITVWLCIVAAIGLGCLFSWLKYDAYRTEKRQEAEDAAYEAKMKPIRDCEARNAQFSNAEEACQKDPRVVLYPVIDEPPVAAEKQNRDSKPSRHVKALQDADLTTTEFGPLKCGHIKAGEGATLLDTGSFGVRLRTTDGHIGWAYAGYFEIVSTSH